MMGFIYFFVVKVIVLLFCLKKSTSRPWAIAGLACLLIPVPGAGTASLVLTIVAIVIYFIV